MALRMVAPWAWMGPQVGCALSMDGSQLALRMDGLWAGMCRRHAWAPTSPRDRLPFGVDGPPYQKQAEYIKLNSPHIYTTNSQKSLCHHEIVFKFTLLHPKYDFAPIPLELGTLVVHRF